MWECPDFFLLDGKAVLLTSPMDMLPHEFEYHNGNGTLCLIGSYDEETDTFVEEHNQAVDYGIDFMRRRRFLHRMADGLWLRGCKTGTPVICIRPPSRGSGR